MQIVTLAPLGVGTLLWQPDSAAWTLTVVAKAAYTLIDGAESPLCNVPEPVTGDHHYDDDPNASLAAANDLVPFKQSAEILIVGHAYAPRGEPAMQLVARATVGEWSKSLGIVGDRIWWLQDRGYRPGRPRTFTTMSLRYERAVRSPGNPIGLDPTTSPVPGALALPNLEAVDIVAEGGAVGFGPIAPGWAPRREILANAALDWASEGRGAAPPGFDFAYFNAAPRDQQVEILRPNSTITLENLHPDRAELTTKLAPAKPRVFLVDASSGRASEIAMRCDTLVIDTDRSVATLTWRGLAALVTREAGESATLVVATDVKGRELRPKQIERALHDGGIEALGRLDAFADATDELSVRHVGLKGKLPPASLEADSASQHSKHAEPELRPAIEAAEERASSNARTNQDLDEPTATELPRRQTTRLLAPPPEAVAIAVAFGPKTIVEDPSTADERTPLTGDPRKTAAPTLPRDEAPQSISNDLTSTKAQEPPRQEDEIAATGGVPRIAASAEIESPVAPTNTGAKEAMRLDQYARLAVYVERGEVSRALEEFEIQLSDLMEAQRSWSKRLADDPALAKALVEAMEAARWE